MNPVELLKLRFGWIRTSRLSTYCGIKFALWATGVVISIGPVRRMCSQSYSYSAPQRMQTW